MPARHPALAIAFVLLFFPMHPGGAAPQSSAEGAPAWWEDTALDANGNGIDDALEVPGGGGRVRVLVSYASAPTSGELAALTERGGRVLYVADILPVAVVEAAAERIPDLAAAPGVVLVEADRKLEAHLDESRRAVGAEEIRRAHGLTGKGVTIAVFDTGIDPTHPDLRNRVVARYDGSRPVTLLSGLLGGEAPHAYDVRDGHGTHVAGIAAGPGSQSGGRYAGVAPGAALVDVKVFDAEGDSASSYVIAGLDWVMARKDSLKIRVAQMSLGGDPTDGTDALSRAVDVAAERGLLTVASAGNKGPDPKTIGTPGAAARALTVGAVDDAQRIAEFSSRGPTLDGRQKPDVTAPGVRITSTVPAAANGGSAYGEKSGTSMAAPHVAGVAALLFEANGTLAPAEAKWILVATSRNVGSVAGAWDPGVGWGFLDGAAAVAAARDPSVLGTPRYAEKADAVPFDGPVSPLAKLDYDAGKVQRRVPAAGALAVGVLVAGVALTGCGSRARRAS